MTPNLRDTTVAIIRAATAAHRCREAAQQADEETHACLLRAAARYSGLVSELAGQLLVCGPPR